MTVKEAAERLDLSVATIYQLCATRKIRHERHGVGRGTIRISEDAIDEYRQSVTVAPAVPQGARRFRHLT